MDSSDTAASVARGAPRTWGIASTRTHGPDAANYERKDSTSGQPYFVLKASNGLTIGRSEMYSTPAARDNGIASVQKNSPSPTVKDLT